MEVLYSLYDALVGIDVPADKARAAVNAMERDFTTVLASKADLQLLKQELSAEITAKTQVLDAKLDLLSGRVDVMGKELTAVGSRLTAVEVICAGLVARTDNINQRLDAMFARQGDYSTKSDLTNFATKADLANFATKADLEKFATKADLANFATKADIALVRQEMAALGNTITIRLGIGMCAGFGIVFAALQAIR